MLLKISVKSTKRTQMIDITDDILQIVSDHKITTGYATLFVPHTTAAVTINEGADPDVQTDMISTLSHLIPQSKTHKHMEGNSDAHIKCSLIGASETVFIEDGRLVLGTWQHIFFFEGDGPRNRSLYVKIIKEQD